MLFIFPLLSSLCAPPAAPATLMGKGATIVSSSGQCILICRRQTVAHAPQAAFASEFLQRRETLSLTNLAQKEPIVGLGAGLGLFSLGCLMINGVRSLRPPLFRPFEGHKARRFVSRAEPEEATSTALALSVRSAFQQWQLAQATPLAPIPPASALPADVQRALSSASAEVRLKAYQELLEMCGRNYMSLNDARLLKAARRVLCPTNSDAPNRVRQEALTQASVAAVRSLAAGTVGAPDEQQQRLGGWLLFLLRYVQERAERGTHVAVDEEAAGMFFDIPLEEEKTEVRESKATKLFADVLGTCLPPRHFGEGADVAGWSALIETAGETIREAYVELEPPADEAIFWIRTRARATLGDMFRRAFNAMAVAQGAAAAAAVAAGEGEREAATVLAAKEGVSGDELLEAALQLARMALEYCIQLYDGVRRVTQILYLEAADEHLAGAAGDLGGATSVHRAFIKRFVGAALNGRQIWSSTSKFDAALLRRLLGMSGTLAEEENVSAMAEAVGADVATAALERPDASSAAELGLSPRLSHLEEVLEIPSGRRRSTRHAALRHYARSLVSAGGSRAGSTSGSGLGSAVCEFLGVSSTELEVALAEEAQQAFASQLAAAMTTAEDTVQTEPLVPQQLLSLAASALAAGLDQEAARGAVVMELREAILGLLAAAAQARKRGNVESGIARLSEAVAVLDGPGKQLLAAFPASGNARNPVKELGLKGELSEVDEMLASELCWEVLDGADVSEELETVAQTALDLMGIK